MLGGRTEESDLLAMPYRKHGNQPGRGGDSITTGANASRSGYLGCSPCHVLSSRSTTVANDSVGSKLRAAIPLPSAVGANPSDDAVWSSYHIGRRRQQWWSCRGTIWPEGLASLSAG